MVWVIKFSLEGAEQVFALPLRQVSELFYRMARGSACDNKARTFSQVRYSVSANTKQVPGHEIYSCRKAIKRTAFSRCDFAYAGTVSKAQGLKAALLCRCFGTNEFVP